MGVMTVKPEHEAAYNELCSLLARHKVPAPELLAIAANIVGKILAMQDQRTMSPAVGMEIIARNIEIGNERVLEQLLASKGSA